MVYLRKGQNMKKIMIASDIHGSAAYLEKLLEAYKQEKADRMLLLGDLLYHGPRNDLPEGYQPKRVIELLNGMKRNGFGQELGFSEMYVQFVERILY